MKTHAPFLRITPLLALTLGVHLATSAPCGAAPAEPRTAPSVSSASSQAWTYTLLPGSQLMEDWPLPAGYALSGTFQLRLLDENPLFTTYAIENVAFTTGGAGQPNYRLTGGGRYTIGGEVAVSQDMFLELRLDTGAVANPLYFTNTNFNVERLWPMLQSSLAQTNPGIIQRYSLEVASAPFREVWFSTVSGFTPGVQEPYTNHVTDGDLVSSADAVVQRNADLTARLGIMPPVPDLGLDAVQVMANGETLFSLDRDVFSESLGPLQHGDLLSERGYLVRRNQDLTAAFLPMPPVPDVGLDAVQVLADGEVLFSIETEVFSQQLGIMLPPGALLSSHGRVVKSNQELIARFLPADPKPDYGLDAVYLWPSGEIWFSVETGFYGSHFEFYAPGDLLSDQGYVVYRNLDLLGPFQPLEDLADFGLDGLAVRTDLEPPSPPPPPPQTYALLPGSHLIDDCFCGRPTLLVPMRGSFQLQWIEENPLFATYAVTNVAFTASNGGQSYKLSGHGLYRIGGEVALVQEMFLALMVDNGSIARPAYFTNDSPTVERLWPMVKIHLDETNQPPIQFYRLDLAAAPLREIWFSTAHGFTPGVQEPLTNYVTAGDLVSSLGRVVKRNRGLTRNLGLMPSPDPPDLGLDAVDILPRGEIAFSIERDVLSESLGPLYDGDVVSDRARIVASYADLIGAFGPEPPAADEGLDALHVLADGEIYFSVTNDFFSESLGLRIRRGDLLSSRGAVVRTHDALLARFNPPPIPYDWGLDAVYVWPSGELWFSLEEGFTDGLLGQLQPGDLLSDQGYVVYRNRDLLAPFQPLEELADFGLDALFVVSDAVPPSPAIPAPRNVATTLDTATSSVRMQWEAAGRLFQLEKAPSILGPWLPLSPILTEPPTVDPGTLTNSPQGYYRLRQW